MVFPSSMMELVVEIKTIVHTRYPWLWSRKKQVGTRTYSRVHTYPAICLTSGPSIVRIPLRRRWDSEYILFQDPKREGWMTFCLWSRSGWGRCLFYILHVVCMYLNYILYPTRSAINSSVKPCHGLALRNPRRIRSGFELCDGEEMEIAPPCYFLCMTRNRPSLLPFRCESYDRVSAFMYVPTPQVPDLNILSWDLRVCTIYPHELVSICTA